MANAERVLRRLKGNCPPEVDESDVDVLVRHCFDGYWHRPPTGSHQWIVEHDWFVGMPGIRDGTVSLSVHHGKVNSVYVKRLLRAIERVQQGRAAGIDDPKPRRRS